MRLQLNRFMQIWKYKEKSFEYIRLNFFMEMLSIQKRYFIWIYILIYKLCGESLIYIEFGFGVKWFLTVIIKIDSGIEISLGSRFVVGDGEGCFF